MHKTRFKRMTATLIVTLGWLSYPAAAELRVAEFTVDVRQRVDAFAFGHPYEDKFQEGRGMSGYEPTGRSELAWANLTSTFTEVSMGLDLPTGRRLRIRGGRGDFQSGKGEDLDYGASGNLWSHAGFDASAGGITSGSISYSMEDDVRSYWGLSGTRWDLHLDGGQNLMPGTSHQLMTGNSSTYNAQRFEVFLGTGFDHPIGNSRIRLQGDVVSGAGWVHSEAHWVMRNLTFTQDGFSLSGDIHLGMGIALTAGSRIVLDASGGGTYVPIASGSDAWTNGRTQTGSGITILASHWALGAKTEVRF